MSYETLNSIYVIAGIACLVMLAVTVALFFLLKIPEAVAFISGRTKKKGIEAIQRTGTTGSRIGGAKSKKLAKPARVRANAAKAVPATESAREKLTDVLPASGGNNTEVLSSTERLTTVLYSKEGDAVLESAQVDHQGLVFTQQPFVVEFDITYVYSDIIIGEGQA